MLSSLSFQIIIPNPKTLRKWWELKLKCIIKKVSYISKFKKKKKINNINGAFKEQNNGVCQ